MTIAPSGKFEQVPGDQLRPWYTELNRYHWFVLAVAALGWLFDAMDQQLFVLARTPALTELLGKDADITRYGGYATTILILGWATGGLVFGMFGDRWGRARTMMITILIYSIFTGMSGLAVSWWDFACYRFLTGLGVGGEFAAGVSLVAEVMPSRARPFALGLLQALSAVGNIIAAGISFLLPPQMEFQGVEGWRLLFMVGILPSLLVIVIRSKLKEPEAWMRAKQAAVAAGTHPDEAHQQLGDLRELLGDRRWRFHTLIGAALATTGVIALWGVGFWTPELVRNHVLQGTSKANQDWFASMTMLLQNVGAFFGMYVFSRITAIVGRRMAFAISFMLGWASIVMVFGFMTEESQILWMIPLLGFSTLMAFGGYAIYFPELFPTRLRSTGTGICYNGARYIAAAAPFMLGTLSVWYLDAHNAERAAQKLSSLTLLSSLGGADNAFRYAALTVGTIYALGILVLPFCPETRDKPLSE
ncbi:MAG: MFS transporter [Pirellulales bacterium]